MSLPSPEAHEQQQRLDAVNFVLEDMRLYLPSGIEPNTWSAMRNYMVARLGQYKDFDNLLLRNASIEIMNNDGMRRLSDLIIHAGELFAAFVQLGPMTGAALQSFVFSEERLLDATRQLAAYEARLVECDAQFVLQRNLNDALDRVFARTKSVLQMREQELEQAQRTIQEKDEELKRTKHILQRVEAERDRSSRTADYVILQLGDLERRLKEAENIQLGSQGSGKLPVSVPSQPRQASAPWTTSAPAGANTNAQVAYTEASTELEQYLESAQDKSTRPESRFTGFFKKLATKEAQKAESTNGTMEHLPEMDSDASVKMPVVPHQVVPCMPRLPQGATTPATNATKKRNDLAEVVKDADDPVDSLNMG